MAGSETIYTFVVRGTAFFERGRGTVSRLPVERSGETIEPVEEDCSYELYGPAGTAVVTGAVVVAADGIAEVSLQASDLPASLSLGTGYQERWTLALPDGSVRALRREVVLGRFELQPPLPQGDLLGEYPDLLVDLGGFGTSLQPFMDLAWGDVTRAIVRRGDFPDVFCEPSDVYEWFRETVFERVFRALTKAQASNQRWYELWQHHLTAMRLAREAVQFLPDRDRDGRADSQSRESVAKSYHLNVPPARYPRRDPRW